jgi:hypothetical protein
VKRIFAGPHAFQRLRTSYERRADTHHAMISLACSRVARDAAYHVGKPMVIRSFHWSFHHALRGLTEHNQLEGAPDVSCCNLTRAPSMDGR